MFPVLWMLLTSLHSETDAATNPPSFFAPLTLEGYANFFGAGSGASPWPPLINSLTASVVSTLFVLVLAIPAAYALSIRPVRKWTDVMFFFLSTKMLPVVAGLLPIYLIAQNLGHAGQHLHAGHPLHLDEPADRGVDDALVPGRGAGGGAGGGGDGRLRTAAHAPRTIVIPMVLPGIAATSLICFIFSWNELLFARVLTATVAQTAPVFLTGFVTSQGLFLAKVCAAPWRCRCRCSSPGSRRRTSWSRACRWAPSSSRASDMKAAVIASDGVTVETVPDPRPAAREVVLAVAGCGICGTDLHIADGQFAPTLPVVPGHEFAGEVVAVGAGRARDPGRRPGGRRPVAVLPRVLLLPARPGQPVRALGRASG